MNRRDFLEAGANLLAMNFVFKSSDKSDLTPTATTAPTTRLRENSNAVNRLLEKYVATWNESDPIERRRLIASVWAKDGLTCYRLLESRGYQAIESRVASSWEKSLKDGKHIFRGVRSQFHHDIVRFDFELATIAEGAVEGPGLSFLILDANCQIYADLQFNPKANDAADFAAHYISCFNESDEKRRRERIVEMWSPQAILVEARQATYGHSDLTQRMVEFSERNARREMLFTSGLTSQTHHSLITLNWELRKARNGEVSSRGSDLVMLDDKGRIKIDYRFEGIS